MLIAHKECDTVYIITMADVPGVTYPGAGTERFATMDDVKARWPGSVYIEIGNDLTSSSPVTPQQVAG